MLLEIQKPKVSELGGKGYSLAILASKGFDVPKGFVVTSKAFLSFLEHNNLVGKMEQVASRIDKTNFKANGKEIRSSISAGEMPPEIVSETEKCSNSLDARYVAVRSSAVGEDSLRTSFAGMHDTYLNIKSETGLIVNYVKKCWASFFNERAIIYRIRKSLPHLESMAVLVQEMVPSEISGTTFTAHPDTRDVDVIVIECSWGLGEAVVSGLVIPDRYIVEKSSLKVIRKILGSKKVTIETTENGVVRIDTPEDKTISFCLDDVLIENLAKVCLDIERVLEYPQDIEWCIQENKIWLLQSRYITTLGGNIHEKSNHE
ncbi:hypothetical protein CEE34_02480 [Candidatus Aerophobetes bacterium Ae_b3a]|nr:MAG: hypothetical protein CEE34_02480 [Candidatus Aerophobetes bacterium Ae_b3a]